MTEIRYRKAKELVTFRTGKLDSNAAEESGRYPFFTCAQETYLINKYAFDTECVLLAGNNAGGIFPLKFYRGKFNAYQRTYILTTDFGKLNTIEYVFLKILIEQMLETLRSKSLGTLTRFLTMGILNPIVIALPPLPEQTRIVQKLTELLSLCDRLESSLVAAKKVQGSLGEAVVGG